VSGRQWFNAKYVVPDITESLYCRTQMCSLVFRGGRWGWGASWLCGLIGWHSPKPGTLSVIFTDLLFDADSDADLTPSFTRFRK
jgi:hypothetical protein